MNIKSSQPIKYPSTAAKLVKSDQSMETEPVSKDSFVFSEVKAKDGLKAAAVSLLPGIGTWSLMEQAGSIPEDVERKASALSLFGAWSGMAGTATLLGAAFTGNPSAMKVGASMMGFSALLNATAVSLPKASKIKHNKEGLGSKTFSVKDLSPRSKAAYIGASFLPAVGHVAHTTVALGSENSSYKQEDMASCRALANFVGTSLLAGGAIWGNPVAMTAGLGFIGISGLTTAYACLKSQ